jgi:cytochrome c peroxidase
MAGGVVACTTPEPSSFDAGFERSIDWAPPAFGGVIPSPERNPLTQAGVGLGRRLFYDRSLSADGAVSCATCHIQGRAFADGISRGSDGVSGQRLGRHAPVLQNLAWHDLGLFWDGGASDLESLVVAPLISPDELGADPDQLVEALADDPLYVQQFDEAFGAEPSLPLLMRAVAQFMRTLVSGQSRYDAFVAGEATLSADQMSGLRVFEQHCVSCHPAPFFTDHDFHNLGLETEFSDDPEDLRKGRGRITEREADFGRFKTPSLRNVTVSAPYLHDGRLYDLRAVLERYRDGLVVSDHLDPALIQDNGEAGLPISDQDIDHLEAFFETLEDRRFLNAPEFGEP